MSVNMKNVIRMMGILLFVIGLCIIPSLIVAIIYQETVSIISFLVTMVICLGGGLSIMCKSSCYPLTEPVYQLL